MGGVIYPKFSRFKFGDVRNVFPVIGGQVLEDAFNERPYAGSYYLGARGSYGLPFLFRKAPTEIYARFGIYNAHHHSSFNEAEPIPEVYVPYIDGGVRAGLGGGSVVGLFANSDLQLHRKLFSYEVEAGIRSRYSYRRWTLLPGLFFTYQRIQQRDSLDTSQSFDPTRMTLLAHINSRHYSFGCNCHFLCPLFCKIYWLNNLAIGAECASGRYLGEQRFAGVVFSTPDRQSAFVSDRAHDWGVNVGFETGLGLFCVKRIAVSILGNMRYNTVLPFVSYPVPIVNTNQVNGPAHLDFQDQFAFGGEINLSYRF